MEKKITKEDEQRLKEAFETIIQAFEVELGLDIDSISGIDFIVSDDNKKADETQKGFTLLESKRLHRYRGLTCRRVNGRWICN